MNHKKINKKDLGNLLHQWSKDYTVFVPSKVSRQSDSQQLAVSQSGVGGGTIDYRLSSMAPWDGSDTGFLDWYRNTVTPPKARFLPPVEEMLHFQKGKEGILLDSKPQTPERQLIFGIRSCDAHAVAILDNIFTDGYQDPYYLLKRNSAVLVGLGCPKPYDTCFCTSLGISPGKSEDVDLMFTDIGDEFLIEEISDKGKRLLQQTTGLEDATEEDIARASETTEAACHKVTRRIDTQHLEDKLLSAFEDKDYWEKVAAKCISCGICTFLCPTCYCFDISDELVKKQGARFRSWDSCSFPIYTKMPVENPREEKWQRVRQKVCHKFEFHPMSFSVIACTGCGRCIRLCPVNWDICQTLGRLPAKE